METFLLKAAQLVLALMILVIIHEFGHYFFARIFKIRVNRFYLFFNPNFSLVKYIPARGELLFFSNDDAKAWRTIKIGKPCPPIDGKPTWRDTVYGIGWLPLGGYCQIDGMVDETTNSSQLSAEPKPWEFRSRPAWQRLLVMVGGVLFNFIGAIIIYAGISFTWGERVVPLQNISEGMEFTETIQQIGLRNGDIILKVNDMEVDPASTGDMWEMVQDGSRITILRNHADTLTFTMTQPVLEQLMAENQRFMAMRLPVIVKDVQGGKGAAEAGILPGDRIVAVNSDTVPSLSEFVPLLANYKDTLPTMSILRNNQLMRIPVAVDSDGKIGILLTTNAYDIYDFKEVQYGFFASIPHGWTLAVDQLTTYASSLKMLFTKSGAQSVGGFGTLGSLFPTSWNWYAFWNIAALLSIILAFMNFLPIPALDGGYILFLVWEVITRRRVPDKFLERANTVGMALLFLLLVYANINDIYRLIIK